jgi:hypothetical protein
MNVYVYLTPVGTVRYGTVRYGTVPQEFLGDECGLSCALLLVELPQLLHQLAVIILLIIAVAVLHAAGEQGAGRASNYTGSRSNRAVRGGRGRFLLLHHTAGCFHLVNLRQEKSKVSSLIFYFVFTYIIQ